MYLGLVALMQWCHVMQAAQRNCVEIVHAGTEKLSAHIIDDLM